MFYLLVHVAWWGILGRFGWVMWDTDGVPPPHECSILVGGAAVVAVIMLTKLAVDARAAAARLNGIADRSAAAIGRLDAVANRFDAAAAKWEAASAELEKRTAK